MFCRKFMETSDHMKISMKTGMKTSALMISALLALAACSVPERTDYKTAASNKGRPLDMPPDLVLPKGEGKYVVPDGGTETSATYSDYAKGNAAQNQSCPCKDSADATLAPAKPKTPVAVAVPPVMQDRTGGGKAIVIAEPFDRCWLRVSQGLDQAGIAVEDKDRSKGLFYLKSGHIQLSVQGKAAEPGKTASCEVTASNPNGSPGGEAVLTLDVLYKALNK
jgi:uncharacterized lipoprotein